MQTLYDYFCYNDDYYEAERIFLNLSKRLKEIHSNNMIVSNLSSKSIVFDENVDFVSQQEAYNFEVQKRENIIDFAKLMLGAFLSLSTGFRDFSNVSTEWFSENIDDICSSITIDDFPGEYFTNLFSGGNNEYFSDYLVQKEQKESLQGKSNVNSYKKVLSNSASSFYAPSYDESENNNMFDSSQKSALINKLFYPILLGCSLALIVLLIKLFGN